MTVALLAVAHNGAQADETVKMPVLEVTMSKTPTKNMDYGHLRRVQHRLRPHLADHTRFLCHDTKPLPLCHHRQYGSGDCLRQGRPYERPHGLHRLTESASRRNGVSWQSTQIYSCLPRNS